jgi:hypothetical protein
MCAVLLGLLSASDVFAEGYLKFSLTGTHGFQLIEVKETDGVIEGSMNASWGGGYLRSYIVGDTLYMNVNDREHFLKFTPQDSGKTLWYIGKIWSFHQSYITVWPNTKDGIKIHGEIVDNPFVVEVNKKKQTLFMDWEDLSIDMEMVKDQPGKCRGMMRVGTETVAKINCQSTGSLTDAFFNDPNFILAYLVQLNVMPKDDRR